MHPAGYVKYSKKCRSSAEYCGARVFFDTSAGAYCLTAQTLRNRTNEDKARARFSKSSRTGFSKAKGRARGYRGGGDET